MLEINNIQINFEKEIIHPSKFMAYEGRLTGIIGESGSGKSSLLDVLGLITYQKNFDYFLDGKNLKSLSNNELKQMQKSEISYLRQTPEYINSMTCINNLIVECEIAGKKVSKNEALEALNHVGLEHKADIYPSKLSGGEKQRLMIAMAILKDAKVILCDECTANLDESYTIQILELLKELAHKKNKIVILSTHEDLVISKCDDIYEINEQKIKLIKQSNEIENGNSMIFPKKMLLSTYPHIIFSRLNKRIISYALMCLISSITIATIVFSQLVFDTINIQREKTFQSVNENELGVIHNTTQSNLNIYDSFNEPFSKDIYQKISNIDGVKEVYPFFGFKISSDDKINLNIKIKYNDNKEVTFTNKAFDNVGNFNNENIFPYYESQTLKKICNTDKDGIFITAFLAEKLGIKEIQNGMLLETDIYIPVAIEYVTWILDEKEQVTPTPQYIKEHLSMEIVGIVPDNYRDLPVHDRMYIPEKYFYTLHQQALDKYQLEENQLPYEATSCKVILEKEADRILISKSIQSLDEDISVEDTYARFSHKEIDVRPSYKYLITLLKGMLIISSLMLLIYSFHLREQNKQEQTFYITHGLTKKEQSLMILGEWIIILVVVSILSVIETIILSNRNTPFSNVFETIPIQYSTLVFKCITFSSITTFICEIFPILKAGDKA